MHVVVDIVEISDELGKIDLGCSSGNKVNNGSTKANLESVAETLKENVVVPNAEASVPPENVVPDTPEKEKSLGQVMTGNVSDEHTIV
ncbi:hypothetical protein A2U01_0077421, partial [Trifolium medium]|nr:hypothetical protein [Trifolium medium]